MSKSLPNNKQWDTERSSIPQSSSLETNLSMLKETFDVCDDIVFQQAQFGNQSG
ncbi:hypothetical protein [Halobacillus karajensis]|nr:hypothetical protein [Halobacillus karajensis]CDQ20802.1 hypothetical protein BN982_03157 [Halobacillus karajensis]CDQ23728.1 hypothetical protein BN983_01979 [Halobacillus karajensis]CDQ27206.1 hypothetical protein BN981_01460 [Halobacillus karajensis]